MAIYKLMANGNYFATCVPEKLLKRKKHVGEKIFDKKW